VQIPSACHRNFSTIILNPQFIKNFLNPYLGERGKNEMKKHHKKLIKNVINDTSAGSLLEYGLIIGFSIAIFLVIVGIVTSILEWTQGNLADFFSIFQG
jgi:hypothetical protein